MFTNITVIYEGVYALNELKKFYNINAKVGELRKNGYEILTIARKKYVDQKNAERMVAEFCEKFDFEYYNEYLFVSDEYLFVSDVHEEGITEDVEHGYWLDGEEYDRHVYIHWTLDGDEFRAEEVAEEFVKVVLQAEEFEDWSIEDMSDNTEDQKDEELQAELDELAAELDDMFEDLDIFDNDSSGPIPAFSFAVSDVKWMADQWLVEKYDRAEIGDKLETLEETIRQCAAEKDWAACFSMSMEEVIHWFSTKRAVKKNDITFAATAVKIIMEEAGFDKKYCKDGTLGALLNNTISDQQLKDNVKSKAWDVMFEVRKMFNECK